MEYRVGSGFDVHPFAPGRPLIVGGVRIPHQMGLSGDSDADVLYHSVADALLGAAGAGDLGLYFSPGDPLWAGLDSAVILAKARSVVLERGLTIVNVDITVIAQEPRLSPFFEEMKSNLARHLDLDSTRLNIKAKSTDHLGFVGRGEGIAALVTVLLATGP